MLTSEFEVLLNSEIVEQPEILRKHTDLTLGGNGIAANVNATHRRLPRRRSASSPVSIATVVDLPAPFGPSTAQIEPFATSSEMESTAVKSPNFRVNW